MFYLFHTLDCKTKTSVFIIFTIFRNFLSGSGPAQWPNSNRYMEALCCLPVTRKERQNDHSTLGSCWQCIQKHSGEGLKQRLHQRELKSNCWISTTEPLVIGTLSEPKPRNAISWNRVSLYPIQQLLLLNLSLLLDS